MQAFLGCDFKFAWGLSFALQIKIALPGGLSPRLLRVDEAEEQNLWPSRGPS